MREGERRRERGGGRKRERERVCTCKCEIVYCIFATSAELSFRLPVCWVGVCKTERENKNGRDGERRRKEKEGEYVRDYLTHTDMGWLRLVGSLK